MTFSEQIKRLGVGVFATGNLYQRVFRRNYGWITIEQSDKYPDQYNVMVTSDRDGHQPLWGKAYGLTVNVETGEITFMWFIILSVHECRSAERQTNCKSACMCSAQYAIRYQEWQQLSGWEKILSVLPIGR